MGGGAAKAGVLQVARSSALAAAVIAGGPASAGPLASPGCLDGGSPAVVRSIEAGLDIRLQDGRLVRLPGLDAADDTSPDAGAGDRLRQWLVGQPARVLPLGTGTDRWGRTTGMVFAATAGDGRPVSVGEALLDAGLARARPSPEVAPCWATYLRLEAGAREAHRGVWAEAGPLAPDDAAALQAHLGRFVVVEGTAESVFEGRARSYLRFAGTLPGGFAVSFERRTGQRLAKAGLAPETWPHRRLRIRGLLDDRWGPQVEITAPDQVEMLGP